MKNGPAKNGSLSIFHWLFISHLALGVIIFLTFGVLYYLHSKQEIEIQLKSKFTHDLENAVDYFDRVYKARIKEDLDFADTSPSFNEFLSSTEEDFIFSRTLAESLFLHFTKNPNGIYLSARFIDPLGKEKVVTEGSRRIRHYRSLRHIAGDSLYAHLYTLFQRLKSANDLQIILFEGPFKYENKMTFLVGKPIVDPEIGGFAGVIIFQCNLADYFDYLKNQNFEQEHIVDVVTLDNKPVFDARDKSIFGPNDHFYSASKTIRLGSEDEGLFKIRSFLSFQLLYKQMHETFRYALLWILLCICPIGLAAYLISKFFSRPLVALIPQLDRVAKGDFSGQIKLSKVREIGILAQSFNTMSDNLKTMMEEQRKLVSDLEQQKSSLEYINRELDSFTYIVSHDLKEPLRSIDAYSKFVVDDYRDKLDDKGKHYLHRIRTNAERMKKLIEDLLEISRLKKKSNNIERVDVGEIVGEVLMRLEYSIKQRGVKIMIKNKLPAIFCDRVRLGEVFFNLVSNAIKFIDKPAPVIEIGFNDRGTGNEFFVKDNGIGIEKQYFEKIFEIFQRLGRREDFEGTGVGLTIVKQIIESHNGKIWVESIPNEGTTFFFTIPKGKSAILEKTP